EQLVAVGVAAVPGYAEVVLRLRRRIARRELFENLDVERLGTIEAFEPQVREGESAEGTCNKLRRWKKTVPAIELVAVVVQNSNIRRPNVVDAVKELIVLLLRVVELKRNAVGNDRVDHLGLRIRHGIQRLASPSTRVKDVEKDELVLGSCSLERDAVIGLPRNA